MGKFIKGIDKNYIEVSGSIEMETARAKLFFDGKKRVWIPSSQIEDMEWSSDHKTVTITIPEWLAFE